MSRVQYPGAVAINRAITAAGESVPVDIATPGAEYFCPFCAERGERHLVIPKQGAEKAWHFAHLEENTTCLEHRYRRAREEMEQARAAERRRHLEEADARRAAALLRPPLSRIDSAPLGGWATSEAPTPIPERIAFYADLTFSDGHVEKYLILREPSSEREQLVVYERAGTRSSIGLDCYPLATSSDWPRIAGVGDARDRVRLELSRLKRELGLREVFLHRTILPGPTEPLEMLLARPPLP